MMHGPLNVKIE